MSDLTPHIRALRAEAEALNSLSDDRCAAAKALNSVDGLTIRRQCHNDEWWYSIVDVVTALTDSTRGRKLWSDIKTKMIEKEGFSELSDEIGQLAMPSADGKMRLTDVATAETILRIIQSISSPKAEPFKRWLARVGYERIQEAQDLILGVAAAVLIAVI